MSSLAGHFDIIKLIVFLPTIKCRCGDDYPIVNWLVGIKNDLLVHRYLHGSCQGHILSDVKYMSFSMINLTGIRSFSSVNPIKRAKISKLNIISL
jgi:hypothetical protein